MNKCIYCKKIVLSDTGQLNDIVCPDCLIQKKSIDAFLHNYILGDGQIYVEDGLIASALSQRKIVREIDDSCEILFVTSPAALQYVGVVKKVVLFAPLTFLGDKEYQPFLRHHSPTDVFLSHDYAFFVWDKEKEYQRIRVI